MIDWERRVLLKHYLEQGEPIARLAKRLHIGRRTIHRLIAAGQLERDLDAGTGGVQAPAARGAQAGRVQAGDRGAAAAVSAALVGAANGGDPRGRLHRRLHAGEGVRARCAASRGGGAGGAVRDEAGGAGAGGLRRVPVPLGEAVRTGGGDGLLAAAVAALLRAAGHGARSSAGWRRRSPSSAACRRSCCSTR